MYLHFFNDLRAPGVSVCIFAQIAVWALGGVRCVDDDYDGILMVQE